MLIGRTQLDDKLLFERLLELSLRGAKRRGNPPDIPKCPKNGKRPNEPPGIVGGLPQPVCGLVSQ